MPLPRASSGRGCLATVAPWAYPTSGATMSLERAEVHGPEGIAAYHLAQPDVHRVTCEALAVCILAVLPEAVGRVWHGHPVWFLEDNPVVGYSVHREGVRLLFWSGQSFDDPALAPVGKFKAAEARFAAVGDIDEGAIRRWLVKAMDVQWDYKNVAKNRGVLVRLR